MHGTCTARAWHVHVHGMCMCMCMACAWYVHVHGMCIVCVRRVHCMYTACTRHGHGMGTAWARHGHGMDHGMQTACTACAQHVHGMCMYTLTRHARYLRSQRHRSSHPRAAQGVAASTVMVVVMVVVIVIVIASLPLLLPLPQVHSRVLYCSGLEKVSTPWHRQRCPPSARLRRQPQPSTAAAPLRLHTAVLRLPRGYGRGGLGLLPAGQLWSLA